MIRQTTIARPVTVSGRGLHTNAAATVTLRPAQADHGRRVRAVGNRGRSKPSEAVPIGWADWVPSAMSTSIAVDGGKTIRTVEHLMAAVSAHGVDNLLVEIDGPEIPIFDGSSRHWCRCLREAGLAPLEAPRRAIRITAPVQVEHEGGFLRAEPGDGFSVDVTHDVLPAFPVMRWQGPVDAASFERELAASRSFGNFHRRLGLAQKPRPRPRADPPVTPNNVDPALASVAAHWPMMAARGAFEGPPGADLLRGWRPWRATLIVNRHILPWPRWPDEPVRHVTLDMIGDLALAGAPLIGRVVAHNPSHFKTAALVFALMHRCDCWESVEAGDAAA